jgi:DNA-binding MarR family transcriptional regulator
MILPMSSPNDRPSFDITRLLGYRLARLSAAIGQAADRDAGTLAGLGLPEYRVMVVLASSEPQGVVGLQEAMLIDKAWISRTLGKLVDKGMVTSAGDDNDARRTLFSLTAKGRQAAKALIDQATQRQELILRGINDRDRQKLVELLSRVQENVDAMRLVGGHRSS